MRRIIQLVSMSLFLISASVATAAGSSIQPNTALTPLEDQVRHVLVTLPYYTVFDNLEFRVEGSQAFLSGQVVRPTLKRDAEAAVRRVAGISSVKNNIEVLPLSSYDDQIRLATYRAIYGNVNFTQYAIQPVAPIRIIVKGGNVTLVGTVASQSDRNIANIRARSVDGVFSVRNELRVA